MTNLENKVKRCYESAPFPDNLRKAKDFDGELQRTINWIRLNLEFLSQNILKSNPKKILCAGCGTGEESISLAKIYPKSQITAIDVSTPSLIIAKINTKQAKVTNIIYQKCSILEDLPKSKEKYDLIYCAGVIHHLANPKQGFDILIGKLKSKGKIVIMLYNSYGLFFYKCQLALLKFLSGSDFKKRFYWIKRLGLNKKKGKSEIYDSYINPQVKTFAIETIESWARDQKLKIIGIVPPLEFGSIIKYATAGQNYIFRRKRFFYIVFNIFKIFSKPKEKHDKKNFYLPLTKTVIFQLIFLVLGKGECQYLLEER